MRQVGHALLALMIISVMPQPVAAESAAQLTKAGESGSRDNWTWTLIVPRGMAIGGGGLDADDVQYVYDQGFRAILNYREEFPDDQATMDELGIEYLFLPNTYAESDTMPLTDVHEAVAFIERMIAQDKPVYVHCTGGWHRSAVGVLAYLMKTHNWRVAQALDHANDIRPGIELRYSDVLYEYEAYLFGEEKLTLDLWTERWDLAAGETVRATAYVTHNGKPVEGARVRFTIEHQNKTAPQDAVTNATGHATFSFTARESPLMQYVHAEAARSGFVAGYDRNLYWVKVSKEATPTQLDIGSVPTQVERGALVTIPVHARKVDNEGTNVRVTVTSECATLFRAYTGWTGKMDVVFTAPDADGEYTLLVHANRFPAEPVFEEVTLVVGTGGPEPPCTPPPGTGAPTGEAPPSGQNSVASPSFALAALAFVAAAWGLRRR